MEHKKTEQVAKEMEAYIAKHKDNHIGYHDPNAIREFNEEWREALPEYETLFCECLVYHTHLLYSMNDALQDKEVEKVASLLADVCKSRSGTSNSGNKHRIYHNIGLCWQTLGEKYRDEALEAFKTSIYFLLIGGHHTINTPGDVYKFTKCSIHSLRALINREIPFSPPQSFNDPFDCPICELLNHDEKPALLMRQAYLDCLTVACFSCQVGETGESNEINNEEPYLNDLMWAHYADSHKGICIKYDLSFENITKILKGNDGQCISLRYVKYSDKALGEYSAGKGDSISLFDSFFLKGKSWEYEKELRLIRYDQNGQGKYTSIPLDGCIKAVYFGLKCTEEDKNIIKKILTDQCCVSEGGKRTIFYQMEKDPNHFGRLRAKIE